ncbi:MAG: aldolase/citrate lyase family protein, partial [Hyphomicrobiaceae bacterium]
MTSSHPPRLRRSLLITPGDRPERIRKAAELAADGVVLDIEDGVGPAQKDAARRAIREALAAIDFGPREKIVRINAVQTADFGRDTEALDVADIDA